MNGDRETRKRFAVAMTGLCENYQRTASPALLRVYFAHLEAFEIEDVERAIHAHVGDTEQGSFWPKPADLKRLIQGDRESEAALAWSQVRTALARIGSYDSVVFDDPVIHSVVLQMGGWVALCRQRESDLERRAREFANLYRAIERRPHHPHPPRLLGLDGEAADPVFVGDARRCRLVLEGAAVPRLVHRG